MVFPNLSLSSLGHNQIESYASEDYSDDVPQGKRLSQYNEAQKDNQKESAQADQRHRD